MTNKAPVTHAKPYRLQIDNRFIAFSRYADLKSAPRDCTNPPGLFEFRGCTCRVSEAVPEAHERQPAQPVEAWGRGPEEQLHSAAVGRVCRMRIT